MAADPLRLEQAVGNMVDNALRHGGRSIALVAEEQGEGVRVQVHDDGPGFPAGFADSAFERFTRGDHARGRGGAGLGLAIVAAIAAAHGGRVGADSPEGGGQTCGSGCRPRRPMCESAGRLPVAGMGYY